MSDQKIIREIVNYLQLSTMEGREKAMWMLLLPEMDEAQLLELKASLEKEVNSITDLYLNTIKLQSQNA